MKQNVEVVEINGVRYVREDSANSSVVDTNGLPFVLIRSTNSGVHFGFLQSKTEKEVTLVNSRRIHYWEGACSLSQIALDGVKVPANCRFSVVVPSITVNEWIEIISISPGAKKVLDAVPVWKS